MSVEQGQCTHGFVLVVVFYIVLVIASILLNLFFSLPIIFSIKIDPRG